MGITVDKELTISDMITVDKKELILDTISDIIAKFLWYDRKEDEELPRGEIEKAIKDGLITIEEICEKFKKELIEHV